MPENPVSYREAHPKSDLFNKAVASTLLVEMIIMPYNHTGYELIKS